MTRCCGWLGKGRDRMSGRKAEGIRFVLLPCLVDLGLDTARKAATTNSLIARCVLNEAYGGSDGLCVHRSYGSRRKSVLHRHVWSRHGV
jgi:hypothetical protein